tara:strand:- start:1237 stop:1611 length:375 start_codon:yes stop_codon:yes gene_type:complete
MQTELFFMPTVKTKLSPLERLKKASNLVQEKKVVRLTDGTDFEFWCTPLTMAEREQAMKGTNNDMNAFALRLFIAKALFEDGRRMFAAGQIDEMRNEVTAEIMDKVMVAILPGQGEGDDLDPKG